MKTTRLFLLVAVTVLAVRSTAAAALVGAFVGPPNNPASTRTDTFPQAGWGFYAPQPGTKQVNRLGFWVSPANPGGVLAIDHDIALYNYTGGGSPYTQIAAATVPAGSTADANGYAWASIPTLTLSDTRQGGDYYIVTATVGTDVWAPNTGSANVSTLDATFGTRTGRGWVSGSAGPPGVGNSISLSHNSSGGYYGPNIGFIGLPTAMGDDFAILSSGSVTFDGDAEIGAGGTTIGVGAVEYLVVGGGGGGGTNRGGGGGAGGLLEGQVAITDDTFDVTVGGGGAGGGGGSRGDGSPGQDSSFGSVVAVGGGRGVGNNHPGGPGGSGGGGDHVQNTAGGSGVPGQGHAGGAGDGGSGGGGGGAGAPGSNASGDDGGDGGDGIQSSITGTPQWYAGGGGGGAGNNTGGEGGEGGGGDGAGYNPTTSAQPGAANTGGGGGGGHDSHRAGGAGGSGVVHIRYAGDGTVATGGTAGSIAGTPYTLHSYTNVGASSFVVDQGIDPASQRATLTGNLSGAGGLTKTAPGTLVLDGSDNSYTGATTVREGTLLVNGALTGTSGVTVGGGSTVYLDNFSGSASDNLHGTQPAIGTGSWAASTHWKADGSNLTSGNANAFLPFTPEPGYVYSLSLDVNTTAGGSDWIALGYTAGASVGGNFHPSPNNAVGWILRRANGNFQTFLGPSAGGVQDHDGLPGWVNVEVQLDTTGDEWLFEWFVDGAPIRGPQVQTSQNIAHVAFGAYGSAQGYVDNFQLDILHGLPTAVLGGSGTIHADTTIGRFGTISPGDGGMGTLAFADGVRLTLEPGAAFDWEFLNESEEGTTYDHIVGDALYLPDAEGAIGLNIFGLTDEPGYSLSAGDRFTLFDGDVHVGSTLFDQGQDITHLFNITDNVNWWGTWEVTAGSLFLTAVPEPGTWLLLLSALACGLLVRRRW